MNRVVTGLLGKSIAMLILVMFSAICDLKGQVEIEHPTRENLYQQAAVRNIIHVDELESATNDVTKQHLLRLEEPQLLIQIGLDYRNDKEMFSRIDDVVIDKNQRIFILDGPKQEIQVFDMKGSFLGTVGRKGRGPGEFEFARSMAVFNDSLLLVNNGFRIEKFDISRNEITFLENLHFEDSYSDLCVTEGKLFAYKNITYERAESAGKKELHTIQAFELPSLKPLFTFGRPYISDNPMVVDRLSKAEISCKNIPGTVIVTHSRMPVLQGFSSRNGQLLWHSYIDGLRYPKIIESVRNGRPSLTYKNPKGNVVDRLSKAVTFSGDFNLLQLERVKRGEDYFDVDISIVSFALDHSDGKIDLLPLKLQKITHISKSFLVTANEDLTAIKLYKFTRN